MLSRTFLNKLLHEPQNTQPILSLTARSSSSSSSSAHYDDLVNAAGRDRDFDALRHILNKRVRDGCCNTTNTFKFLTNTECSLSILDEVVRAVGRVDEGYARTSAYESLIARLCKVERVEEALRVLEVMAGGGNEVRAVTFHPVICALTRKKKMDAAWRVVKTMGEMGVPPDLTAFNYLLTAYCYNRDLTAAVGVLKRIEEEGFFADSRTYDALVLGACRAGRVEGALVVLRRMEDDGVPALYSTHVHVINALVKMGYCGQAVKFVMAYEGRDKKFDSENFGVLASKLIGSGKNEEAKLVVELMAKRGLEMGSKLRDFYLQ